MTAPRKLGSYELIDRIAVGGMAEIYLARATGIQGFEREWVLKLIHPKYVGDHEFIRMLIDEAKLTAQLTHVNIAQVVDFGLSGETYYMAMEYVEGKDLYQILNAAYDQGYELPIDVCVYIARELAAGLFYAHTKRDEEGRPLNLVHRDISPQNVLVSFLGEVKVVDFGVAKAAMSARPETQAGIIKGKFRYMSPEQAWGETLDGRSDIFAAGLCLYEMLTGFPAYPDDLDMQKMLVAMRDAKIPPVAERRPDVDDHLQAVLDRALAQQRRDRFPDAHAFQAALSHYLHTKHPGFTPLRVVDVHRTLFPDETEDLVEVAHETMPDQKYDSSKEQTWEMEVPEEIDTEDMTVRRLFSEQPPAPPAKPEFAEETTELFNRDIHAEPGDVTETSAMNNDRLIELLEKTQGHSVSPRERAEPPPFNPPPEPPQDIDGGARDDVEKMLHKYVPEQHLPKALDLHRQLKKAFATEERQRAAFIVIGGILGLFIFFILLLLF